VVEVALLVVRALGDKDVVEVAAVPQAESATITNTKANRICDLKRKEFFVFMVVIPILSV
jgi:hypothetical protein